MVVMNMRCLAHGCYISVSILLSACYVPDTISGTANKVIIRLDKTPNFTWPIFNHSSREDRWQASSSVYIVISSCDLNCITAIRTHMFNNIILYIRQHSIVSKHLPHLLWSLQLFIGPEFIRHILFWILPQILKGKKLSLREIFWKGKW